MRTALGLAGVSIGMGGLLAGSLIVFGPRSVAFAFCVVWFPTGWFTVVAQLLGLRLPESVVRLRAIEQRGRLYELLGVRVAKRVLRRGPLSVFSRDMRLSGERTPAAITRLESQMRFAEATHLVVLLAVVPVIVHAVARGWWAAAGWTLLFDVLVNAYPAMLQRYNRAWLASLSSQGGGFATEDGGKPSTL